MAAMKDIVALKKIYYACMASSQNGFILPNLPIAVNLSKYKKALWSLYNDKTTPHGRFYEDEWFLDSSASTHFTLFKSDFVNMTLGNYGWVETTNSKALLFMVSSGTILIEYEIFDPEKEITKVAVSKL